MGNLEYDLSISLNQMALNGPIIYLHWILDEHDQIVKQVSPNVERIFGYSPVQLLSGELPLFSIIYKEDIDKIHVSLNERINSNSSFWESSFRIYTYSGKVQFIKAYTYIEKRSSNEGISLYSYLLDQSDVIKEIDFQITLESDRWASAIESAREGVWDWYPQNNEVFFSKHWKGLLGYEEHELPNEVGEWFKRIHPEDLTAIKSLIVQHVQNETEFYECQHRLLHKDGKYRWILVRGRAVDRDKNGKATRMIGTHVDITDQKEMKQLLEKRNAELELLVKQTKKLANTDPLTSLYNRRKMMDEIKKVKEQFKATGQTFALAILDLDYFKQINDKYGHTFGDIALQTFANLLKKKIPQPNVIARWGGEEFIILLPNKNAQQTKRQLSLLQTCCNEELLKYRTETVLLSFSAGVVECSKYNMSEDIVRNADQALYQAKSLGRNQIILYKEGLPSV